MIAARTSRPALLELKHSNMPMSGMLASPAGLGGSALLCVAEGH